MKMRVHHLSTFQRRVSVAFLLVLTAGLCRPSVGTSPPPLTSSPRIAEVSAQISTQTTTEALPALSSTQESNDVSLQWQVVCVNKTELDACLFRISPYMPGSGLPYTRRQLQNGCRAFNAGMKCVDDYTNKCFSEEERRRLEVNLKGARSILAFLCEDPVFQKDYLSHATCLKAVSPEWDQCHLQFKNLIFIEHLRKNITQAERDRNICCIRQNLLTCVYRVSYLKCQKYDAVFLRKVTATLSYSDVQIERCKNVSPRTCSGASPAALFPSVRAGRRWNLLPQECGIWATSTVLWVALWFIELG